MYIQPVNNIDFKAKLIRNNSYEDVMQYALEHNKYDKLNQALKNIDNIRKDTFLRMDICYTGDFPTVVFTRLDRDWDPILQQTRSNYIQKRQVDYISTKKGNPVKFAFEKLIKLGNNAPNNNMYQEVVINKEQSKKPYFLF